MTEEQFQNKILSNTIKTNSPYINTKTKIEFECEICNYKWKTTPDVFLRFQSCPNCTGNRKLTHTEYVKRIRKEHGNKYSIISEYKSLHNQITVKHNECGREFTTNALNFAGTGKKKGTGCPYCYGTPKKTTKIFKEEVKEKFGEDFTVLGEYETNLTYIEMKHKKCNHEFKVKPVKFLSEGKCPVCNTKRKVKSTGERLIMKFLESKNIKFQTQYIFKDCKNKRCLPFDIVILNKDNSIKSLIEFDGIQHFEGNYRGIFTEKKYIATRENDEIKSKYCLDNNYKLLRIPYWEKENIDSVLEKFFDESSTTIESTSKDGSK